MNPALGVRGHPPAVTSWQPEPTRAPREDRSDIHMSTVDVEKTDRLALSADLGYRSVGVQSGPNPLQERPGIVAVLLEDPILVDELRHDVEIVDWSDDGSSSRRPDENDPLQRHRAR